jgi:hypothetical protein
MAWLQHNAKHSRQFQWGHLPRFPLHKQLHKARASLCHDPVNFPTLKKQRVQWNQSLLESTLGLVLVLKQ